jgi:hypothetical protein
MKIDIIFPFVDLRKLSNARKGVNEEPLWPSPLGGFMRCVGSVKTQGSGFTYKGIRLVGDNIPGLIKLRRKIEFPFCNDVFGLYSLSFTFKKNSFSKSKVDDLLNYFQNNVQFKVVNLINNTKDSNIPKSLINLKKELLHQYFWATKKLVEKENSIEKKLYERKNGNIFIKDIKNELNSIKFNTPIILMETTNNKHTFNSNSDYHPSTLNTRIGKITDQNFIVYHLKRNWQIMPISLNRISSFTLCFIRYIAFFNLFYKLIEELQKSNQFDENLINNLTNNFLTYFTKIRTSNDYEYFAAYYKFLLSKKPDLIPNLLAKINNSNVLTLNQKHKITDGIINLIPDTYIIS